MDYKNGKIYKLVNRNGMIYIGSTCQSLTKRKCVHKSDYNAYLKGNSKSMTTSIELFKNDPNGVDIVLIEKYPCNDKMELHKRERYWIECMDCINKIIPTRTKKEYLKDNADKIKEYDKKYREENKDKIKKYREENKDKIREQKQKYREENKDKIKDKKKEYYEKNKDKIKEYRKKNDDKIKEQQKEYRIKNADNLKKKHKCDCGGRYTTENKSRHFKSKKHIEHFELNDN